jgi:hypothetical protein
MAECRLGLPKIQEMALFLVTKSRNKCSKKDGPTLDCSNFKSRGVGPSTSIVAIVDRYF